MTENTKPKKKKAKPLKQKKCVVGHNIDGTPIRKSFYGHNNREIEAKRRAFEIKMIDEKREQDYISFKVFSEDWLEKYKKPSVSPVTYKNTYKANLKTLNAAIGDLPLVKVTSDNLQKVFGNVSNYSHSKAQKMEMIAKAVLEHAVSVELLDRNPMKAVVIGKTKKSIEKQAYTGIDYRTVVDFAKTNKHGIGPFIALMAGLRLGELCALQWSDINFEKKILHVRKAVSYDEHGHCIIKDPKTLCSIRDIPLPDEFCQFLGVQIRKDRFIVGIGSNMVVDTMNYIHRQFENFRKELLCQYPNLRKLNMHELRHSFGTIHYKAGTPIDVISSIMGHSSIETTKKIYVHDNVEDARNRINFTNLP